jgi:Zn-dependent membrane protease YugP
VNSAYSKYKAIYNRRGISGAVAARTILDRNGLSDVSVEMAGGRLTDHYDPKRRKLVLSEEVYNGLSVAAVSIAAHEAGHAIQHGTDYAPLTVRSAIAPVASFSSRFSWLLIIVGMFIVNTQFASFGPILFDVGIYLYVVVLIFQTVTLPVEFDASKRAREQLINYGLVYQEDLVGTRKILSAAALTYVAAMASALLTLVRMLVIRNRR